MGRSLREWRDQIWCAAALAVLLAVLLIASSGEAFARGAAADQYASAASDQYQASTGQQAPVGPNDPDCPDLAPRASSQTGPSQTPAGPHASAHPESAAQPQKTLDRAPRDVPTNRGSLGQGLAAASPTLVPPNATPPAGASASTVTAPPPTLFDLFAAMVGPIPSASGFATVAMDTPGSVDQRLNAAADTGSPVAQMVVGALDPYLGGLLGPASVVIGPSAAVGGGGTGFPGEDYPYQHLLVDDPGDSDGDGAEFEDLNPGSYDADPTDHDDDDRISSETDSYDPGE